MKSKNLILRIIFDLIGASIGATLAYFAFFIILDIQSLNQWEQIVGFAILLVASGFIVGFFAFKKDGIFLSGTIGLVFLVILTIFGIKGIGLYEIINNYVLTLLISIIEGIIFFCISVLSAFLGSILTPTLWQFSKREIDTIKDASIGKKSDLIEEKNYCESCGSEIPRNSKICIICGKKL